MQRPSPEDDARGSFRLSPAVLRLERPRLLLIFGLREDPWIALDVPGPAIGSPYDLPFETLSKVLAERRAGSAQELRHTGATYGIHFGTYDRYPSSIVLEVHGQLDAERAQSALRSLIEDIHGWRAARVRDCVFSLLPPCAPSAQGFRQR